MVVKFLNSGIGFPQTSVPKRLRQKQQSFFKIKLKNHAKSLPLYFIVQKLSHPDSSKGSSLGHEYKETWFTGKGSNDMFKH